MSRIVGYEARNSITVNVKDLGKVGAVLDKAVGLGVNSIRGPVFGIQDKDKAQDEARLKAMQDVKARAALYEKGMGLKLGHMLQISESSYMPQQRYYADSAIMEAKAAAPTPVEAGEMKVTAQVTTVWEILP